MQMELERLRVEREANCAAGEGGEANQARSVRVTFEGIRSPDLPHFVDGKDDLDSYLLRLKNMLRLQIDPKLIGQLS